MCVLTIHNTEHSDGGKWVCHITSKLDLDEYGKNIQNTGSDKNFKMEILIFYRQ